MKLINGIGFIISCMGLALFLFGGGRFVQHTATELTNSLWIIGGVLALFGLLMSNAREEWFFEVADDEKDS